ncbi:ELMO/CED-12 family protein (macronuclear) [Tetrahymena thermophila SB210]|uniref:ELMO/CED-12 family protein n=1 Tax=Tetrahymena thermophila (strain SB210) TaxID=312017 RepID=I7LXF8_TETTS|nr:ELMO/CED-12 family protein [Tetrahymena thermophila SB210]EAS04557.1 ELMO/CED-12 family protein [Tetrahymena thermophila SB210]|eukprot:XP_001024802.1 ELMO/CED-12 family protein [Tetrahymena thermophila SB210]
MQDVNTSQQLDEFLQQPSQQIHAAHFTDLPNQNQIKQLTFDLQQQASSNNIDLPNLLDLNLENHKFSAQQNENQLTKMESEKGNSELTSTVQNVGRMQVFPPILAVKKNVSIQNNHTQYQYPCIHQSSEDLRSLTQSQSRFSNRKTEATSCKNSIGREYMSSSFFSEGDDSNFSRKNSDATAPAAYNPSIISTTSETTAQKNSIKLSSQQNNQAFNRSSNQIKKARNSLVCIEDLIFQQSLQLEEEEPQSKVIRVQIPSQNNNFQDESDVVNEEAEKGIQQQVIQSIQNPLKQQSQNNNNNNVNNEQVNQSIQQNEGKQIPSNQIINNIIIPQPEIQVQTISQNLNNVPDLLDEGSFVNITANNNIQYSEEQKNQNDSSPKENTENTTDKEMLDKNLSDAQSEKRPQMNVLPHLNEDETSSDDPEMIKPVGFTIHIDHEECYEDGDNTLTSTKRKRNKNQVLSYKNHNYKQITYMEAWSRVKTMDLSKEKKLLMAIRDSTYQGQGIFSRVFTFCTNNSSKILQTSALNIERDQILAFSKVAFDTSDSLHVNMIYTIYCSLRNTQYCPLYGPHWLTIGFRHVNPKQNFDIAGVFGALQILAFIFCYKEYILDVVQQIDVLNKKNEEIRHQPQINNQQNQNNQNSQNHNNSQNSSSMNCNNNIFLPDKLRLKEINLCVVMQEITKHVLIWLEKGLLNQMINVEKSVISVVNKMYFATFYIFYENFKREKSGFLSISIAFKTTIEQVEQNPFQALEVFKKKIGLYYKLRD